MKFYTSLLLAMVALFLLKIATLADAKDKDGDGDDDDDYSHNPFFFALKVIGFYHQNHKAQPQKEIKLIGAGWPRTGTKSTKAALEILGYKVLHMEDMASNKLDKLIPMAMVDDAGMDALIDKILQLGYNATIDGPTNLLTFELAKRFPNAKILLGQRDNVEVWVNSYGSLLQAFGWVLSFPLNKVISFEWTDFIYRKMGNFMFVSEKCKSNPYWFLPWVQCYKFKTTRELSVMYTEWNEKVTSTFGKDRLLTFNVKQGWKPLTQFLGKPLPDVPFPWINESDSIANIGFVFQVAIVTWPFWMGGLLLLNFFIGEQVMRLIRSLLKK